MLVVQNSGEKHFAAIMSSHQKIYKIRQQWLKLITVTKRQP